MVEKLLSITGRNFSAQARHSTHVKYFLTQLAVDRQLSSSSQNQAFNALLFFYRHVLEKEIDDLQDVVRAKRRKNLPVVLTKSEISRLFRRLNGVYLLMAQVAYGGGLRLRECLNLRVKDIDFERNGLNIIGGKGDKDRPTTLPQSIQPALREHLDRIRAFCIM